MANPDWLGYEHAALGLNCLICHPTTILQESHKNITTMPTPVIGVTKYSNSVCFTCHGSYAALIELTKDSKAFLAPDGTAINPHNTHEGELECYNCHQIHQKSPGVTYCYGCHHTGDLECGTCHVI
jgi:hypothetical protein